MRLGETLKAWLISTWLVFTPAITWVISSTKAQAQELSVWKIYVDGFCLNCNWTELNLDPLNNDTLLNFYWDGGYYLKLPKPDLMKKIPLNQSKQNDDNFDDLLNLLLKRRWEK